MKGLIKSSINHYSDNVSIPDTFKKKIIISQHRYFFFLSYLHCDICISISTEAIKNMIQYLGLQPCERSDKVPEGKSSHTLYLAGIFRGGHDALVRSKLALDSSGVTMQLTVRSTDPYVSEILATAIA